jgi:hypothetical protein
MVGWLTGPLASWLAACLTGWLACWLVGRLAASGDLDLGSCVAELHFWEI